MARTLLIRGHFFRFRDGRLIPIDTHGPGARRHLRVLRKPSARF